MRGAALALALALIAAMREPIAAQQSNLLVGTWQRFQTRNRQGEIVRPEPPTAVLIFSADGYYSQVAVPRNRPRTTRPLSQLTIKELLARFEGAEARYGRYTVSGNRLSRTTEASLEPFNEGAPQVRTFRVNSHILILSSITTGDKSETRFRRRR